MDIKQVSTTSHHGTGQAYTVTRACTLSALSVHDPHIFELMQTRRCRFVNWIYCLWLCHSPFRSHCCTNQGEDKLSLRTWHWQVIPSSINRFARQRTNCLVHHAVQRSSNKGDNRWAGDVQIDEEQILMVMGTF